MANYERRFPVADVTPFRCESCGTEIGVWFGDSPPDPSVVIARCFACAATEEAEAITQRAASPEGGE